MSGQVWLRVNKDSANRYVFLYYGDMRQYCLPPLYVTLLGGRVLPSTENIKFAFIR